MQRPTWIYPKIQTKSQEWDLTNHWVRYQDTSGLNGVPRFELSLDGYSYRNGQRSVAWDELFSIFDLVWVEGQVGDGSSYQRNTMQVGLIIDIQVGQTLTADGYTNSTTLVCENFQHVLARDAAQYWVAYGSARGYARSRAELTPEDVSGKLERTFHNYMQKIAFSEYFWNKDGRNLKDYLSYGFTSLTPSSPPLIDLSVNEGTHWGMLSQHIDAPLLEFYTATLPRITTQAGVYGADTYNNQANLTFGEDESSTTVILRPSPFPYGEPDSPYVNASEWNNLYRWDLTNTLARPHGNRSLNKGMSNGHYNFYLVQSNYFGISDRLTFGSGIAVDNPTNRRQYGYSPLRISTKLMQDKVSDENILEVMRRLTWRVAGQNNKLHESISGTITIPFEPYLIAGERILTNVKYGDNTIQIEAYIENRSHNIIREGAASTTLAISRGHNPDLYQDPTYFIDGLTEVGLNADTVSMKDNARLNTPTI